MGKNSDEPGISPIDQNNNRLHLWTKSIYHC